MGNQLKHDIREYMRNHPGVKYTEARNAVLATENTAPSPTSSLSVDILASTLSTLIPEGMKDRARKALPSAYADSDLTWNLSDTPLYGIKPGDIILHNDSCSAYLGGGKVIAENGDISTIGDAVSGDVEVLRPSLAPTHSDSLSGTPLSELLVGSISGMWSRTEFSHNMYVPLGHIPTTGHVFGIDVSQTSDGGSGPHGVVQGRTGSGKTAFLRNIVLALAATHSPDRLNFVLADGKGAASFSAFDGLPHVTRMIGRMGEDVSALEEFAEWVFDELTRRAKLLEEYGVRDAREYLQLRKEDADLPPLPSLIVVVEEAVELLKNTALNSSVHAAVVSVARRGRALGVHLLVSAQEADPSVLRNIQENLSYGVSFTTRSANYSRAVLLGDPGAAHLPLGQGDALVRYTTHEEDFIERIRAFAPEPASSVESIVSRIQDAAKVWEQRGVRS